ncbi:MAG: 2-dehydropantoate 2-reductase [Glaciecola sp.]
MSSHSSVKRNIAIAGQGAIGSLFAHYWRDFKPMILTRSQHATCKNLDLLDGSRITLNAPLHSIRCPSAFPLDAIIVPVKCYQVAELAPLLSPWMSNNTAIVLIQNGMGGGDILADMYPTNPLYVGTTTDAVYKQDADSYRITAVGRLDIGPFNNALNASQSVNWLSAFATAHPNANVADDIRLALYRKLAINAVINPLTALLNIKNGELTQYPEQLTQAKTEVFAVYEALQIALHTTELEQTIDKVIESTSDNYSSMQQDVFYQRETEIEGVLGYLVVRAQQHHIHIPFLTSLYQKLVALKP